MSIHIDTVYAAMQIIPAVIGIAQGKDPTTKATAGSLIVVAAWLGLRRDVSFIHDATNTTLYQVLAIAGAVLAVVVAVRFKERLAAGLIISGAALLALHALQVVGD